jgi:hypothetical protein
VTTYDGIYYGTTTYCLACNGREQDGDWRRAGDRYADLNREYVNNLWRNGVPRKVFLAKVSEFERSYWEAS